MSTEEIPNELEPQPWWSGYGNFTKTAAFLLLGWVLSQIVSHFRLNGILGWALVGIGLWCTVMAFYYLTQMLREVSRDL